MPLFHVYHFHATVSYLITSSDYYQSLCMTWSFTLSATCLFFRLVSFRFPFNTCISPDMLDLLLGHDLPWSWFVTGYISSLVMLSFHIQHDIFDHMIIKLREYCLVIIYGTKCHTVQWWGPPLESIPQNKVPHGTKCHIVQWWGPPLESVGATSWICKGYFMLFPLIPEI